MKLFLTGIILFIAGSALALEPIQVSKSVFYVRGATGLPSAASSTAANELVDFEEAYRNAYNTYIRIQGGDK